MKQSFNYHFSHSFARTLIMVILVPWKRMWLLRSLLQKFSIRPKHMYYQKLVLGLSKTWTLAFLMQKQVKIQFYNVNLNNIILG